MAQRIKRTWVLLALAAVSAAAIAVVVMTQAGGSKTPPSNTPQLVTATALTGPTPLDRRQQWTRLVVETAWNDSASERSALCRGVRNLGAGEVVDILFEGTDTSSVDLDYAAQLLTDTCAAR